MFKEIDDCFWHLCLLLWLNLQLHCPLCNMRLCVHPDLQLKAAELNKTLSRKDGTPDKSLSQMNEEIQAMLEEMRKRQLGRMKITADEEKEYGNTLKYTAPEWFATIYSCSLSSTYHFLEKRKIMQNLHVAKTCPLWILENP